MKSHLRPLSLLIYLVLFLGLASLNGGILALAIPLIVYLLAGVVFSPQHIQLEVSRELSQQRIVPGSPVEVRLHVTNRGPDLEEIFIEDDLPAGLEVISGSATLLTALPSGAHVELAYTARGRRGAYTFTAVKATAGDPFGLVRTRRSFPAPGRLTALPHIPEVKRVPIRPRLTRPYAGLIPARRGGPGVEFFGVRLYHNGDPLRRVNWRLSARYDEKLFVTEFEQERVVDVGIILDARSRSNVETQDGSLFEYQVQAAAGLAQALLRDGNRLSLLVYGQYLDRTFPGYGKIQRERILYALSRAQPGDSQVFDTLENLPTRLLPIRSQVILISPMLPDDLNILLGLRARGYQLLIISPDPVRFQSPALAPTPAAELALRVARLERGLLFNRLRRAGIHVIDWDISVPFDQVMRTTLRQLPLT